MSELLCWLRKPVAIVRALSAKREGWWPVHWTTAQRSSRSRCARHAALLPAVEVELIRTRARPSGVRRSCGVVSFRIGYWFVVGVSAGLNVPRTEDAKEGRESEEEGAEPEDEESSSSSLSPPSCLVVADGVVRLLLLLLRRCMLLVPMVLLLLLPPVLMPKMVGRG